ncbi:MAG: ATP-binding protein [Bacteroidales bacterium]
MGKIERDLRSIILNHLEPGRILIVSGPEGVGKTHLLKDISCYYEGICLYLHAGEHQVKKILLEKDSEKYRENINNKHILLIDDAHLIPNLEELLQSIKDSLPHLKTIITATFKPELRRLQEKCSDYTLYTLTHKECQQVNRGIKKLDHLEHRLIYGNYPKILEFLSKIEKQLYLNELFDIYLIRDILTTGNKKKMKKVIHLLRLISYFIGQEIFYRELEKKLSMNRHTVEKYLYLMEELSIIHQLKGFKKNLKKEVSVNASWYFMDNGLRNAIADNFNPLESRDDVEKLWKNYLISERIKKQKYRMMEVKNYFWRTYDQQEIDMVEEMNGQLSGFIFSWDNDKHKIPIAWRKAYPNAEVKFITPNNYLEWIH